MTIYRLAHYTDPLPIEWRWPDFSPQELRCKGSGQLIIDTDALDCLQALRDALGKPIMVVSAGRSEKHNRAVGGAKASQHLTGSAFDCSMANHDPIIFESAARRAGFTGFGFYPKQHFIHIDIGPAREWGRRWAGEPFDAPEREKKADRPGTVAGVAAGAASLIAVAAENADQVVEQATSPALAPLLAAVPWLAGALGGLIAFALIVRFWKRRREEKAE